MTRYQQLFNRLAGKKEGAFIPFVSLGDPAPELSLKIIDALIAGGADALELGIPFSDPLADGPTIQGGNLRALSAGVTPTHCFELLTTLRRKYPEIPIGLLMYANLVFNRGIDNFYARCQQVGIDSVLTGDVPLEESAPFRQSAMRHNVASVFICPPDASDSLVRDIASHSRGYVYLQSRPGVTGTDNRAESSLSALVNKLRACHAAPAVQGFGISEPAQVRRVIASGAAGAIAGSATVKLIERHHARPDELLAVLRDFTRQMKAATR